VCRLTYRCRAGGGKRTRGGCSNYRHNRKSTVPLSRTRSTRGPKRFPNTGSDFESARSWTIHAILETFIRFQHPILISTRTRSRSKRLRQLDRFLPRQDRSLPSKLPSTKKDIRLCFLSLYKFYWLSPSYSRSLGIEFFKMYRRHLLFKGQHRSRSMIHSCTCIFFTRYL
jgi:hypothetical protein